MQNTPESASEDSKGQAAYFCSKGTLVYTNSGVTKMFVDFFLPIGIGSGIAGIALFAVDRRSSRPTVNKVRDN